MTRGPNQHYVPKFLQRSFGIPPKRNQIWYFERNEMPEKKRIKRTGSEAHFYSRPTLDGQPTLDDAITASESDLALCLDAIRSQAAGDPVDPNTAAAVILHLAPRTAHVRNTLQRGVAKLIDGVATALADSDNVRAIVGLDGDQPTDRFRDLILSDLVERPEVARANIPTHVLERMAFCVARENFSDIARETLPAVRSLLDKFLAESTELVREGHNKALVEIVKPGAREESLATLDWTIENAPSSGAILPDCVAIAIALGGDTAPLMFVGNANIQAVIMPVAPTKLLIGRKDGYSVPHHFDYNREAARASHTFFLSPADNAETSRVHPMIRELLPPLLEQFLDGAVQDILPEPTVQSPTDLPDGPKHVPRLSRPSGSAIQYELSLIDCGDRDTTARISEAVQNLVSALSRALPLGRLDGITITNDYPAALKALDRGFDNAPALETVPPEIGIGIAQMATVVRAAQVKGRIVMSSSVAQDLIASDSQRVVWAIHVFAKELALIAMIDTIERNFPGTTLSPVAAQLDRGLYAILDPGLHVHVASSIAAAFGDPDQVARSLRQYLAQSIDRMISSVSKERLAYRQHRDLDRLVGVAFPAVRQVLIHAADLLGHCAVTGVSPTGDSHVLTDTLDRAELTNWFRTYADNLEQFRNRLGQWASFDEFTAFNTHVERLLWHVGIIPSEGSKGILINIFSGTHPRELSSTNKTSGTSGGSLRA